MLSKNKLPVGSVVELTHRLSSSVLQTHLTQGLHYMFYSRVTLGRPQFTKSSQRFRRPENDLDCVIANQGRMAGHFNNYQHHREFIVYDRHQTYPEYLIAYRVV